MLAIVAAIAGAVNQGVLRTASVEVLREDCFGISGYSFEVIATALFDFNRACIGHWAESGFASERQP